MDAIDRYLDDTESVGTSANSLNYTLVPQTPSRSASCISQVQL